MAQLTLRIPDSLSDELRTVANAEGVSVNHYVSSLIAGDIARRELHRFLKSRAENAPTPERYHALLRKVPQAPVRPGDEM